MEEYARVCAYVDLDALHENINSLKINMNPKAKMIAVIKTDAYGHGAIPIAWEMEPLSVVHGFAVATVEEAIQLRKAGIEKPILILGYTFPYSYPFIAEYDLCPTVFKKEMLLALNEIGKKKNKTIHVHIKVDTGMSRIGIFPNELGLQFVKDALTFENLCIEGIFTHFANADEADKTFANQQFHDFMDFVSKCEKECSYQFPYVHCSNSPGMIEMPYANDDLVRAGIALYGMWPSSEVRKDIVSLKALMSLKSHIVFIKEVEDGTPVSYNGSYVTKGKTRIATIPVGYGDGYPRKLSNKGYVLINNKKAAIIGKICMDQFMVDVSNIDCEEGDEVILIGEDGENCITMEELGELSGRFNYELACNIGKRIPRVFMKQGKMIYSKDYYDDIKINIL